MKFPAIDHQGMDLVFALGHLDRASQARPFRAVEGVYLCLPEGSAHVAAEGADVQHPVVHEHRMNQARKRTAGPPRLSTLPYVALVVVSEDVQVAVIGSQPEQPAAPARRAAVFPFLSAPVAIDMARIQRLLADPRPVVAPVRRKQTRFVNDHRTHAAGLQGTDATAVFPARGTRVAVDVGPVTLGGAVGGGGVEAAIEDGQGVAHVAARGTRPAAVLPLTGPGVVDAERDMPVATLAVVATGSRVKGERETAPRRGIEFRYDIAERVEDGSLRVDPRRDREVACPRIEHRTGRNFEVAAPSVELPGLEVYAVVHCVVFLAGVISCVSAEGPVTDQLGFTGLGAGGHGKKRSRAKELPPCQ